MIKIITKKLPELLLITL